MRSLRSSLSTAAPPEVAAVVMQALRWTIRLATECSTRDLPVAVWISTALDDEPPADELD